MSDFINSVLSNETINTAVNYVSDSFMSIFILGVLTGWLIEWIFYNLFWKQRKNKDIAEKVVKENKEPEKVDTSAEDKQDKQQSAESNTKVSDEKQAAQEDTDSKDELVKQKVEQQVKDVKEERTENKIEKDQMEMPENTSVEQETKKVKEKQKTQQDVESKDKKASSNNKEEKAKPAKKASKPTKADDFTKLYGVGPSIAKSLKKIEIDSFKQLSELSADVLVEKLIANGANVVNKGAVGSWAEQAKLANAGDFDGLKAFQKELKKLN